MRKPPPRILVSDFDGTMTKFDFFDLARRDLPSAADRDFWQDYVNGQITHFEALAGIFAAIRTDGPTLEDLVDRMELDPALPDAVARLRAAGWEIVVASAGCDWYIRRLLAKAGVQLEVHANPGVFAPATGLQLTLPVDSPYFKRETGIDKSALVRAALARDPRAVFAGDGRPDLAPSTLVAPGRRFATGWLARHLQKNGEEFRPFETWSQIAEALLEEPPC
ncbi:MAG: 2,3-diketo-5-methylthio-1-phosphopentane phosphatase [Opitutae bacterium]|nr:2,3-diketo-5-methylthio-1-phosphopentane phosphatase [Opitutae bacterium]